MHIAALLTGRGNNTLKDKNVISVLGNPMLYYPCMAAQKSSYINSFWVSSECPKILNAANLLGYTKILRPADLSLPTSQHIDAIDHALLVMAENGLIPDILIVLMANSVTIKPEWLDESILMLLNNKEATAVVPVYREMDHHPFRCKKLNEDGFLEPFFDFNETFVSTNRQELEPAYFLSHNFWVLNLKTIDRKIGQKPWIFMGNKIMHILVDDVFDSHTLDDVKKSETWLKKNNIL